MQFFKVAAFTAFVASAQAAVTAQQMISNIDALTDLSSESNNVAKSIAITNFFSTTPNLINNYSNIINMISDDINAMKNKRSINLKRQECLNLEDIEKCLQDFGEIVDDPDEILGDKKRSYVGSPAARSIQARQPSTSYIEADQQAICSSFRGFVTVHKQLLSTVIEKHALLSQTPYTQPIASVLRSIEGAVDTLAIGLIGSVPSCAQDATQNKDSLETTIGQALTEYTD